MGDSPSQPNETANRQPAEPTTSGSNDTLSESQETAATAADIRSASSAPVTPATDSAAARSAPVEEFSFDPWADGPTPPDLQPRLAEVAKITDPMLRQQVEANI